MKLSFRPRLVPRDSDERRGYALLGGIGIIVLGCMIFGARSNAQSGNDVSANLITLARQTVPMVGAMTDKQFAQTFSQLSTPPTTADACTPFVNAHDRMLSAFSKTNDRADAVRYLEASASCEAVLQRPDLAYVDYSTAADARSAGYHNPSQQRVVADLLYAQQSLQATPSGETARLLTADALQHDRAFTVRLLRDPRLQPLSRAVTGRR